METKVDFKSIVLKNGLLLGGVSVAFSVLQYIAGMTYSGGTITSILVMIANIVLAVWIIAIAIQQYKDANEGFLSVSEAIKVGVVVAAIAAVISVVYMVIFNTLIEPEAYEKGVEISISKMEEMGTVPEDQIEKMQELMLAAKSTALIISYITNLILSVVGGLIIAAIVGAVKKNERSITF